MLLPSFILINFLVSSVFAKNNSLQMIKNKSLHFLWPGIECVWKKIAWLCSDILRSFISLSRNHKQMFCLSLFYIFPCLSDGLCKGWVLCGLGILRFMWNYYNDAVEEVDFHCIYNSFCGNAIEMCKQVIVVMIFEWWLSTEYTFSYVYIYIYIYRTS